MKDRHVSSRQVHASNTFMMAGSSSLIAFLLIAAMGVTSLPAQSLNVAAQAMERPSGCHGHGHKAPAPKPASYKCCLSGHNIAIPQSSASTQPASTSAFLEMPVASSIAAPVRALAGTASFASSGPPGSPLRI
jgi:hypothetical protein